MNVAVVGYGSAGQRHAHLLSSLGHSVSVISSRQLNIVSFKNLAECYSSTKFSYLVVANSTSLHLNSVREALSLEGEFPILVEKPLSRELKEFQEINGDNRIYVAYNLRFHPLVRRLKGLVAEEKVVSVQAYVGQYLPDWRKQRSYSESYSAKATEGGGVLRDLSHELDYLLYLLGDWESVAAVSSRLSDLQIDSDDHCLALLKFKNGAFANLQMNYIDRCVQRTVTINTLKHTFVADFIRGTLSIDGRAEAVPAVSDETYLSEHRAILNGDLSEICNFRDGLKVMELIASIEVASREQKWVVNSWR